MQKNIQLLKQVRSAVSGVAKDTDSTVHQTVLSMADLYLNELMLREDPTFYLEHLKRGKALLKDGEALVAGKAERLTVPNRWRDELSIESRIEAIDIEMDGVLDALNTIVFLLDENRSPEEKQFLVRISQWESGIYSHHAEQGPSKPAETVLNITPESFQGYLAAKYPQWHDIKVREMTPLDGGFSKKTILVETTDATNGPQSLVIRAELPTILLHIDGSDLALEFQMIQYMRKSGIPVAEALCLEEDASLLGARFILSRKAEGEIMGAHLGGNVRSNEDILAEVMAVFYQLHTLKPDASDPLLQKSHLKEWLPHKTVREAIYYFATGYLRKMIQRAGVKLTPQLIRALRWLETNVPDCDEPPAILHADYAANNILIRNGKVSAVLDWETSLLGDPAYDIVWTQRSLGNYPMPEFLARYKEATGRDVSEYRLAYANVAKFVWMFIGDLHAVKALFEYENCPLSMGVIVFKFMPILTTNLNELIETAESARGR